jgi:hypothetical protein
MFGLPIFVLMVALFFCIALVQAIVRKDSDNSADKTKHKYHDNIDTFDVSGENDTTSDNHAYSCRATHNHAPFANVGHIIEKYIDVDQRTGENLYYIEYILESNPDNKLVQKVSKENYIKIKIGEDVKLSSITNKIVF